MNLPSGYKGKLSFFASTNCGHSSIHVLDHNKDGSCWADKSDGYVRISEPFEVDVPFFDVRQAHIEALEKAIESEKAASHRRIQVMLGQIQELRAIEAPR